MQKLVKKYGGSLVILLDNEDTKILNLDEDDLIDVEIKIIKKAKEDK